MTTQDWFNLAKDEDSDHDDDATSGSSSTLSRDSQLTQKNISDLSISSHQTLSSASNSSRVYSVKHLSYEAIQNSSKSGAVPRLHSVSGRLSPAGQTSVSSTHQTFRTHQTSNRLSELFLPVGGAGSSQRLSHLSQYCLSDCGEVHSHLKRQSETPSQYTLSDMDSDLVRREDKPGFSQDNLAMNHTTSTNESQNEESSQISPPRGFSSDDGSGWKSETTESDGNFSLSQYPLDVTGDDSGIKDASAHEEFVSSAISEVSKDFIAGNFSPSKYPPGSGESDSMSDADHNIDNNQYGAVYARYPESATGLSDCEWNPYATESDTNHTPRSSVSEGPMPSVISIQAQHLDDRKENERSTSVEGLRNVNNSGTHRPGSSKGDDHLQSQQPGYTQQQQPAASYVLYSPDTRSTSTITTAMANSTNRIDGRSNTDSITESGTLSSQGSVQGYDVESFRQYRVNQFLPPSFRQTEDKDSKGDNPGHSLVSSELLTGVKEPTMIRPEPIGRTSEQTNTDTARSVIEPKPLSTNDLVRVSISRTDGEPGSKDTVYLPIEERDKLLGYSQSLDLPRDRQPDFPRDMTLDPARERLSDPGFQSSDPSISSSRNRLSDGALGSDSYVEPDSLSLRVAKLLTDANQLGSTLHESLYNKKALGLENHESFPKYKFSPVKNGGTSIATPSPTGHGLPGEELIKSGRSQASDHSLRSSLGEEVAKLMAKADEVSESKSVTKSLPTISSTTFKPISEDKSDHQKQKVDKLLGTNTVSSLETGSDGHTRTQSEESQGSTDSLDQRVKDLLQKTSYVEKKQPRMFEKNTENLPFSSYIATSLDYSRLQKDLQEIQNSLTTHMPADSEKSGDNLVDSMKQSEKSFASTSEAESYKGGGKKLLWDHAADLGYDDSATGQFLGTMKSVDIDTEGETSLKTATAEVSASTGEGSYLTDVSGKLSQKSENTMKLLEGFNPGNESAVSDVVSDQLDLEGEVSGNGNVAPDVEEIIARYQKQKLDTGKMETQFQEDTTGLANRVFKILTQENPEKHATGILEKAMKDERKLMQKLAERPKLDSSYDGFGIDSAESSFAPHDKDIRKQLEWSEMSSLDQGHPVNKTGVSEMSFKGNAPFSSLGTANTFLSSQLQKMSDRTFDHSIELRTPFRRVIECYPVYGVEKDPNYGKPEEEKQLDRGREAWPEVRQGPSQVRKLEEKGEIPSNPLASERFFLNALDTTPVGMRYRRYSDPRDRSPDSGGSPIRESHTRSKSEENKCLTSDAERFYNLESYGSGTSRRIASSPPRDQSVRPKEPKGPSPVLPPNRRDSYESTPPVFKRKRYQYYYRETSPSSSGVPSPGDSDLSSTRRREGSKLRPYRPPGSRDVYYTESADESASVADSITTMESTHTGGTVETMESSHSGSDDAVGPYIPSQHLGSRVDLPGGVGIYSNRRQNPESIDDGLSTIEEKSIADEREQHGGILKPASAAQSKGGNFVNDSDRRDSGLELSSKTATAYDRAQSRNSDRISDRSTSSRHGGSNSGRDSLGGSRHSDRTGSTGYEDSKLSYTTRSDPGDQFATPKRARDYNISSTSDHMLQSHHDTSEDRIALARAKSRSETDLSAMSQEPYHKSSSPMYGTKLMDLSAQPSPILSLQTTMNSPAGPSAGMVLDKDTDSGKYLEDRVRQKPLEKGADYPSARGSYYPVVRAPDYPLERGTDYPGNPPPRSADVMSSVLSRHNERVADYSRRPLETGAGLLEKDSDKPKGSLADRASERMMDYPIRPLDRGSGLLDSERQREYSDKPIKSTSDPLIRPLEKGEGLTERTSEKPGELSDKYNSRPYNKDTDFSVRPLDVGPGLLERNTVRGPETSDRYSENVPERTKDLSDIPLERGSGLLDRDTGRSTDMPKMSERLGADTERKGDYPVRPLEKGSALIEGNADRVKEIVERYKDVERRGDYPVRPLERGTGLSESRQSDENSAKRPEDKVTVDPDKQDVGESRKTGSVGESGRLGSVYTGSNNPGPNVMKDHDFRQIREGETSNASKRGHNPGHHDGANVNNDVVNGTVNQRSRESLVEEKEKPIGPADMSDYLRRERGRPLDRGADYLDAFIPQYLAEPGQTTAKRAEDSQEGQRSRERSEERRRRSRSRSPANSLHQDNPVEYDIDGEIFTEPPKVPDPDFEDIVKAERLKVRKELEMMKRMKQQEHSRLLTEEDQKEFGAEYDCIPPSRKAQALRETLEKEAIPNLPSNINELWNRFQEMNETHSDSSMNTSRIDTLASLLHNPTRHVVYKALDERTYQRAKERKVSEELVALDREQRQQEIELRRQELQKRRKRLSDEGNGSYTEVLNGQRVRERPGKEKAKKEKNNQNQGAKSSEEPPRQSEAKQLGESADTLYSIPEDTSFDSSRMSSPKLDSTNKSGKMLKAKHSRQRHVIDPLMSKLRDKVQRQRDKINKERIKEMKRMDKLKKLELLLTAKRRGKLTDKAINVELEDVSSTSVPQSDESSTFLGTESTLTADSVLSDDSNRATVDTTSSKDSSIELQRTRIRKPKQSAIRDEYGVSLALDSLPQDSESQSDIVVVRKSKKSKGDKSTKTDKKSRKKEKVLTSDGKMAEKPRSSKRKERLNQELTLSPDFERIQKQKYRSEVSPSRERLRHDGSPVRNKKYRDIGVNYPSPIIVSPPSDRWMSRAVKVRSEAVQTDGRSLSPSHIDTKVIPVPLMSPEVSRKSRSTSPKYNKSSRGRAKTTATQISRSKSPHTSNRTLSPTGSSPARSQIFSRSYTPPRSQSPSNRSKSPLQSRNRSSSRSKMFIPESDSEYEKFLVTTPPRNKMFTPETPDDEYSGKIKGSPESGGLAWYIPVEKEKKPWRRPLKEQQAYAVKKETWQPKSVKPSTWKNMVNSDILNKSRTKDTQFNLDTKGQRLEEDLELKDVSDEENIEPKPLNKLSLQDAFNVYKQSTISRVRARQKRVALAAEERKLQHELAEERNRLFAEQRKKEANPDAHPYSENLHEPKKRAMTKQEMKELTKKSYKKLPEVVKQKQLKKRQEDYALNRLKARIFNRKVQKSVLHKTESSAKC